MMRDAPEAAVRPVRIAARDVVAALPALAHVDPASRARAARDYGGVYGGEPIAVLRPRGAADVARILQFASEEGIRVAVRGAGHSQNGFPLSPGGLVLETADMVGVGRLSPESNRILALGGTSWGEIMARTSPRGVAPPVLTDHAGVSVGGTLSIGGVGPASFLHGLQAEHCLGLEVVLGTGEILWADGERHSEIFDHVRCGLGSLGVITRAELRLGSAASALVVVEKWTDHAAEFLANVEAAAELDVLRFMTGFAHPAPGGAPPRFVVHAAAHQPDVQTLVAAMGGTRGRPPRRLTFDGFVRRHARAFSLNSERIRAHPWVEHVLPLSGVAPFVEAAYEWLQHTSLQLLPIRCPGPRLPHFSAPEGELAILASVLVSIAPERLGSALPHLERLSHFGSELGGKRYLSGWLPFEREDWVRHYGTERWARFQRLRERCDPRGVLSGLPR